MKNMFLRIKKVENPIFGIGILGFNFSKVSMLLVNSQLTEEIPSTIETMSTSRFIDFPTYSFNTIYKCSLFIFQTSLEHECILLYFYRET